MRVLETIGKVFALIFLVLVLIGGGAFFATIGVVLSIVFGAACLIVFVVLLIREAFEDNKTH